MPHPKRSNSTKVISAMKPLYVSSTPAGDSPTVVEAKARKAAKKKVKKHFEQSESSVGLLVTEELESAIARCKARVETISASCRADNQKFTYA
jgi:benzoyl-CoA reductase/2-hydroxyglutaryl-CoA dehydratase subunit BcrC/BadD/HgdB